MNSKILLSSYVLHSQTSHRKLLMFTVNDFNTLAWCSLFGTTKKI